MKMMLLLFLILISPATFAQFTNESEVGIAATSGNTKTQTYSAKQLNDYKWESNVVSLKARYLNAKANKVETARFAMVGLRYEKITSTRFSFFIGETLERDKFVNIDQRLIFDLGGKYRFVDTEMSKWFAELGYRYMNEDRLDGSSAFGHYARAYSEWDQKWNNQFSTKYWAEFLPNLSNSNDWQLNTEFSISAMLSSKFSMKSGILIRYDHMPAPGILNKTDTLFSTALVAKF